MNRKEQIEIIFNDVKRFRPLNYEDERGYFSEIYRKDLFEELKIGHNYIQDNYSYSKNINTVRGLHFQLSPKPQKKIIKVISGKIWDVFIDLREHSPNFKEYSYIEHGVDDGWLYIPDGYAHGFCTLEDNTILIYKVDNYYYPELDSGINYLDPDFNISWPTNNNEIIISEKDRGLPFFEEVKEQISFSYES